MTALRPCLRLLLIVAAPVSLLPAPARSEDPEEAKPLAIRGGTILTITDGVLREGTVLVEDGRIAAIGSSVSIPEGAQIIEAAGKVVMPGFIAARMSGVASAREGKVADALDAYGSAVSFALASGVTAAYVQVGEPGDQPTGGSNAVVKLIEGDPAAMLVREPVAVNIVYSNRAPRLKAMLRQSLAGAQRYLRRKAQYEQDKAAGKQVEEPAAPPGAEPLVKLLTRELPARLSASSANDILAALELVDDFGLRMILDDVVEGWTVPEAIARRQVEVVVAPRQQQEPDRFRSAPSGSSSRQAAVLSQAGVRLAIVPLDPSFQAYNMLMEGNLFTLQLEAALAVGGGLDEAAALQAVTLGPAAMLGVADRMGSLQVGKDADIIILDGHPLHYRTLVDLTVVNGRVVYDRSKSTYFSDIPPRPDGGDAVEEQQ